MHSKRRDIVPQLAQSPVWSPTRESRMFDSPGTSSGPSEPGAFRCPVCDMRFSRKSLLDYHRTGFCVGPSPDWEDVQKSVQPQTREAVGQYDVIGLLPAHTGTDWLQTQYMMSQGDKVYPKIYWNKCFHGNMPEFAVKAGYDHSAGCGVFVGRAHVKGQLVPGKVIPANKRAYIGVDDEEVSTEEYEVLTDPNELLTWSHCETPGGLPRGVQKGGYDAAGLITFIARCATPNGNICCGKYVPQQGKCVVPWDGHEYSSSKFEFLVKKTTALE